MNPLACIVIENQHPLKASAPWDHEEVGKMLIVRFDRDEQT